MNEIKRNICTVCAIIDIALIISASTIGWPPLIKIIGINITLIAVLIITSVKIKRI